MNSLEFACLLIFIAYSVKTSTVIHNCSTNGTCETFVSNMSHQSNQYDMEMTSEPHNAKNVSTPKTTYLLCSPDIAVLCKNGATCTIVNGEFECSCAFGYSGYYCEINTYNATQPEIHLSANLLTDQSLSMCSQEFDGVCLNGGTCFMINER